MHHRVYWVQALVALDQLANALLAGWADETLSSRAHRCADYGRGKWRWVLLRRVINTLFFWELDHCFDAFIAEKERRQLPPEMRTP